MSTIIWLLITCVGCIHLPLAHFTFNSLRLIHVQKKYGCSLLNILNTMSLLLYFILLSIIVLRIQLELTVLLSTAFSYCWFLKKLLITSHSWINIPSVGVQALNKLCVKIGTGLWLREFVCCINYVLLEEPQTLFKSFIYNT